MIYGSTQNGVGLSVGRTTEEALHPSLNNSRIFVFVCCACLRSWSSDGNIDFLTQVQDLVN